VNISIVIPTYNRLASLRRVLAGLSVQTLAPERFEALVISDGATDGTEEFLRATVYPYRLTLLSQRNAGPAAARNAGVARAASELILFLDDDVVPAADLLARHLAAHETAGEAAVVLGPLLTPADFAMQPWVRWEQDRLAEQYADMAAGRWEPTARQFFTGNASLGRLAFLEAGGFDSAYRRAEDVELAYRLAARGMRFLFVPEAAGLHYAVRSFRSWQATPYAYGRNDVRFAFEKGQQWLLSVIEREYGSRNALVRALVAGCRGRPRLTVAAAMALRGIAAACGGLQLTALASRVYGAIFNLHYYQGVADELRRRGLAFRSEETGYVDGRRAC
jgi:GT2 family glycosyltransferase